MNQSIHSIDLLQWFMGPVRSIYAYTDTLAHHMETEDVAVAVLRFENGALGTIAATTSAYPGVTTRIEIFGAKGSAVIEDDNLSYLHLAREDSQEVGAYGIANEVSTRSMAGASPATTIHVPLRSPTINRGATGSYTSLHSNPIPTGIIQHAGIFFRRDGVPNKRR